MFILQRIIIEILDMPNLRNPSLVCGFPGSGYVGKLAIDHIVDELKAIPFANMSSSSFPPQVLIQCDGTAYLMKSILYYSKGITNDLILLSGDAQPITQKSEYEMVEEITNLCDKSRVKTMCILAAYITGAFSKTPKVYETSTLLQIVNKFQKYDVSTMNNESITGTNGLILGVGKRKCMTGICLLGETSGYVVDAIAAKIILEILVKMLDLKLDLTGISEKAEDTKRLVKTIEEQMGQRSGGESLPIPQRNKKLGCIS